MPPLKEIFCTKVPIVKHIPQRVRHEIRDALSKTVWAAANSSTNTATTRWTALFLFPAAVLALPPPTIPGTDRSTSVINIFRDRLSRWTRGEYTRLWSEAAKRATFNDFSTPSTEKQARINLQRATRLAKEGAYSKATMALQSNGVASPNDKVRDELLKTHPQRVPETDEDHTLPPRQLSPPATERFTALEVTRALSKFPRASAAGGSGLTATHLDELLSVPSREQETGLAAGLAKLLTIMARVEAPNALAPWIAGAPLTALLKPDHSVRPIAVGETLRRLVSSMLMHQVARRAKEFLQPFQIGVATKGGTEAILHAARRLQEHFGSNKFYALLKLDLKNAFNLVSRAAFIKQVRINFPELEPWVRYCYESDSPYLWVGELRFRSVTGVQQGDPLGPLLFSLALQAALTELSLVLSEQDEGEAEHASTKSVLLQSFYLDDGIIVAKHSNLQFETAPDTRLF